MISGFIHYKTGNQKEIYFESITHGGVTTILNHENDHTSKYMLTIDPTIENNTKNSEIINTIINNRVSEDIQNDLQNVRNELIQHISGAKFQRTNKNNELEEISITKYLTIILRSDHYDEFESYINALYFMLSTENINLIKSFITCIQGENNSYIDLEPCFQDINIKKVFFFKLIFGGDDTNTITQTSVNNKVLTSDLTKTDVTSDFTETINTLLNGPNNTTKKEKINYLIEQFTKSEPSNQSETSNSLNVRENKSTLVISKTTDDLPLSKQKYT